MILWDPFFRSAFAFHNLIRNTGKRLSKLRRLTKFCKLWIASISLWHSSSHVGGEGGIPDQEPRTPKKHRKSWHSRKSRRRFATTAVYHLFGTERLSLSTNFRVFGATFFAKWAPPLRQKLQYAGDRSDVWNCPHNGLKPDIALCPRSAKGGHGYTASIVEIGRHLEGVSLRFVMVDPELRFFLRHYVGDPLHRGRCLLLIGID